MIPNESLLISLVKRVARLPDPPQVPKKRSRGRSFVFTDKLFLKAMVIMIVRHLHTVGELLSVLEQPTHEMQQLRTTCFRYEAQGRRVCRTIGGRANPWRHNRQDHRMGNSQTMRLMQTC